MRLVPAILVASLTPYSFFGQSYRISTFAGGALPVNIPGPSASFLPISVATDQSGNLFLVDVDQNTVLRLDATAGILTLIAGNGTAGFSGDNGPATSARLNIPRGVAVDSGGNVYIADSINYRIRKVSNGLITTVAGNGTCCFSGDSGPATSAQLGQSYGVAVDSAGNLYIADTLNNRVRKVSNGVITTVAGNGTTGFSGDNGPATSARLNIPRGVAVDSAGNLYIADTGNDRIRKVSNGVITTIAGNGTQGFSGDNGPANGAQLHTPDQVAVDSAANLYIADTGNDRIRKVSNGVISTIAGNGTTGFSGDNGPATSAQLNAPFAVAVDSGGNLYIADGDNYRIRKISNGVIATVAGNGSCCFSGDNGPATSAELYAPAGVAVDSAGNLYIADFDNSRIRMVSNGVITTVAGAGNGAPGFGGDNGPATSARLYDPQGVAVDSAGNLYIADTFNNRIRKVSNGVITTVAGGGSSFGDNGPATSAQLSQPQGIAVDSGGNLYIADTANDRVRMVSNGLITTVAGNGTLGFDGDNGPAISAELYFPFGVAVDSGGNLYITDNNRIRMVSNGVITTIAGNGTPSFGGDNGPATSAELDIPRGVAVDPAGSLYIADTVNNRVRLLQPVSAPLSIATPLASGTVGALYSLQLEESGGTPPYSWSLIAGALPNGLALSTMTGTISGTPTASGNSIFTVQVTDSALATATQTFSITVIPSGN